MKAKNQIDIGLSKIEKLDNILETLVTHFSLGNSAIQRGQIFEALFLLLSEEKKIERPSDFWDIDIEYEEAFNLLFDFDFATVFNKVQTSQEIIPEDLLIKFKVRIKSKGLIWAIHKNDADPFPSNPHAHQIDNNIKLDLSNGNCYRMRQHIATIKKKDLVAIRHAASKVFKGKLPNLAI